MLRRGEFQLNREGGPLPSVISGLLTVFLHFPQSSIQVVFAILR